MPIIDFDSGTWNDPWVQELPPLGKLLFNYLWTNDHKNVACLYSISLTTVKNETGMTVRQIEDTLSILYPKVQYDKQQQVVMVLNHVKRQFLRTGNISPKIITAIRKNLLSLPEGHHFIGIFLERYKSLNIFNSGIPYPYPLEGVPLNPSSGGGGGGEGKEDVSFKREVFIKPTVDEVRTYCTERNNGIDAESFIAHYNANGWKVGPNPMKDWKSAVITWEKKRKERHGGNNGTNHHGNNGNNGQTAKSTKYAGISKSAPDDGTETTD